MATDTATGTAMRSRKPRERWVADRDGSDVRKPHLASLVAGLMLAGQTTPALAQEVGSGNDAAQGAASQSFSAAPKQAWTVTPRVSVTETLTNNVDLSANKHGDQITELSPGISVRGESARLKGFFDYQLLELLYAKDAQRNQTQQALNASGTVEAIENWLFVDASGVITQQAISAFGTQATSNGSVTSNRTETSVFRVSPYVRGRLAGYADYELRYRRLANHTKSNLASDVDSDDWSGSLRGGFGQSSLSWLIQSSWQKAQYQSTRETEAQRLNASLSYQPDAQLKLTLLGGRESNNYASANKERKTTTGLGFLWAPTERTSLAATRESRFFGEGHNLSFTHRMPLLAMSYSDSRDVSVLPNQLATVSLGTYYDLLNNLFASSVPDANARAQLVNRLLQSWNLPPNAAAIAGFLTSQVTVERLQALSLVTYGARNAVTLSVTQSDRQGLSIANGVVDDFSLSPSIKQRGVNVNWSYRLSALSSANLILAQQNAISASTGVLNTRQRSASLGLTTKLGSKTAGSLLFRRALFDSSTLPYAESALVCAVTFQF